VAAVAGTETTDYLDRERIAYQVLPTQRRVFGIAEGSDRCTAVGSAAAFVASQRALLRLAAGAQYRSPGTCGESNQAAASWRLRAGFLFSHLTEFQWTQFLRDL